MLNQIGQTGANIKQEKKMNFKKNIVLKSMLSKNWKNFSKILKV